MKEGQIKGKLDKITRKRVYKGSCWALLPGLALVVLKYFQKTPLVASEPMLVVLVPAFINFLKEWMKGKK